MRNRNHDEHSPGLDRSIERLARRAPGHLVPGHSMRDAAAALLSGSEIRDSGSGMIPPPDPGWRRLAAGGFKSWLAVCGLLLLRQLYFRDPGFGIRDPGFGIRDSGSGFRV